MVIWILGSLMAIPSLWMTIYDNELDVCDLTITYTYLFYIISLNIIFVGLPMFLLTYFYICIIIKSKKNYDSIISNMISITDSTAHSHHHTPRRETIHIAHPQQPEHKFLTKENSELVSAHGKMSKSFNNVSKLKHSKKSSNSSLTSIDLFFKLKAKQKYKSTAKISILSILSFWCLVPLRLFICWSYVNSYSYMFGHSYYDSFIGNNYKTIFIFFNISTIVYFLNFVFNCIIYNIFSVQFRKELRKFLGIQKIFIILKIQWWNFDKILYFFI